jgi:UDP-glucose 4-epimerase
LKKFKKYKIGITGHDGVLGSHLLKYIERFGVSKFNGDIRKKNDIKKWLENNNFSFIFHLAAVVSTKHSLENKQHTKNVNFQGTKNLVDQINISYKRKIWLFYSSTSHVYNFSQKKLSESDLVKPISFYGKTKLLGERYIIKNCKNINYCIGRIFSFTSKNQNKNFLIPGLINKIKNNKKIVLNNINHYRDFLTLEDVCNVIKILFIKKKIGIFNICSGKKIKLINIVEGLNFFNKKIIIKKQNKLTTLVGSNYKIKKLGWKVPSGNYISYLQKVFLN